MTTQELQLGFVKFFDNDKGFGFVKSLKNNQDYFLHISKVNNPPISENYLVSFYLIPSKKKVNTYECENVISYRKNDLNQDYLINNYDTSYDFKIKEKIVDILNSENLIIILKKELLALPVIENDKDFNSFLPLIKTITKLFKNHIDISIIESNLFELKIGILPNKYKLLFWFHSIISLNPEISELLEFSDGKDLSSRIKVFKKIENRNDKYLYFIELCKLYSQLELLFQFVKFIESEEEDLIIDLIKIIYDKSVFLNNNCDTDRQYTEAISISNRIPTNIKEIYFEIFFNYTCDFNKLRLWLNNYTSNFDGNLYKINFILLSTYDQKIFIKKCFYLLAQKVKWISLEYILSFKNLTYSHTEGQLYQIDFSCNVILNTIESIINGILPKEEDIFKILVSHVENNPKSLFSLVGFFEVCNGRSIVNETLIKEDNTKQIISLKQINNPRNVDYCEGVKFSGDGKDRIYNHDCWWCRGSSCFNANQGVGLPVKYEEYSLRSFLAILNININNKDYYDLIGLINKINIYIKHINCRSCNYILKPKEKNYYAFYRTSWFVCPNADCDVKESIYLNHCLGGRKTSINSKCDNLIDSRDSVRCNYDKYNPNNEFEKYGPYICSLCGSCCSQKVLEKKLNEFYQRKVTVPSSFEWKVKNRVGHLEKNEIFCYRCGLEMKNNEKEYNEIVKLLNDNNSKTFNVVKNGVNSYGFWFLVKASELFFQRASDVGLRISESKGNNSDVKFISQGNPTILICDKCNTKYNEKKKEFIYENNY